MAVLELNEVTHHYWHASGILTLEAEESLEIKSDALEEDMEVIVPVGKTYEVIININVKEV